MARIKKNDRFCCAACGLEVVVNEACECVDPDLVCCGGPMKHISSPAGRAGQRAPGKTSAGTSRSKAVAKRV